VSLNAKIADVLSETSLVVNVGSADGVTKGDFVRIWEDKEILDPDTHEPLGTVRVTLAVATVSEVQEKLSVAYSQYERPQLTGLVFGQSPRPRHRFTTHVAIDADQVVVRIGQVVTIESTESS
jgi:hypothetical protein